MSATQTLIAKRTLTSDTSTVSFTSIPQTYDDLFLVFSARTSANLVVDTLILTFNSITTGYSSIRLTGTGSTVDSASITIPNTSNVNGNTSTANTFSSGEIYISSYTRPFNKLYTVTGVTENNATQANIALRSHVWANTSAINRIDVGVVNGPNYMAGSTFYLYGINSANPVPGIFGIQASGGEVTISGGYKYHVFKSSGTFNVTVPGWVECLVIGGGGGGGRATGGGGGAGGLSQSSGILQRTGTYPVIVASGGAGGTNVGGVSGASGSNSSFNNVISIGGGGGNGSNGGSGGGSGGLAIQGNSGGATGYGNNGGTGMGTSPFSQGGGGGAGAAGQSGTVSVAGNGGNGLNIWSSWATATNTGVSGFFAGGGGGGWNNASAGGTGGSGGGGNGGQSPTAGTINTGGGGGGANNASGSTYDGAAGGSGIVIIRYPVS